jgi:demethylmenaquinone methyltransferase/2-methoxy-6-polyprenyl-1,4-benzoquinol methylase
MQVFSERLADFDLRRPASKRDYNRRVFQAVAPRYAVITRLLSFGLDALWKRALVARLARRPGAGGSLAAASAARPQSGASPRALDLACGTGDISLLLARRFPAGRIEALDLSPAMLARARRRRAARAGGILFRLGDLGRLPYPAESFHLVTGGYALRNAPDLGQCLREVFRVLRKGGSAAFLDFNRSPAPWLGRLQVRLLSAWGGLWGLLLHGNPDVYAYIAETLALFPDRVSFERMLGEMGFRGVRSVLPPGGFVSLTFVVKP